jgi:hypothetical protein
MGTGAIARMYRIVSVPNQKDFVGFKLHSTVRKKPPINAHTMTMTTITRFLFFSFMLPSKM